MERAVWKVPADARAGDELRVFGEAGASVLLRVPAGAQPGEKAECEVVADASEEPVWRRDAAVVLALACAGQELIRGY